MSNLLVLNQQKEFKQIPMVDLKLLQINFKGWHCPIDTYVYMINPDGSIMSGVCGNVYHTEWDNPWWTLSELKKNTNNTCILRRGNCFCDSDINMPKAINEETFNWFLDKRDNVLKDFYCNDSVIPHIENNEKIIALSSMHEYLWPQVHFFIGKRCNFDCSYCPPGIHDKDSPHLSIGEFEHALSLIHLKQENKKLIITGGEPTLNPDILKMVKYAKSINYKVVISTNGTAPKKRYKELLEEDVNLHISFHPEFSNNKLIEKIASLEKYKDELSLKVMTLYDEPFAENVRSIIPNQVLSYHPIYGKDLEHEYY
jgi:sulfatase maturation enzyme AslB (radical SAM superfamily)